MRLPEVLGLLLLEELLGAEPLEPKNLVCVCSFHLALRAPGPFQALVPAELGHGAIPAAVAALQRALCVAWLVSSCLGDTDSPVLGQLQIITSNLALPPGKRPSWEEASSYWVFFLSVSAPLSLLQSQMKAHGTECICSSAGMGSFPKASWILA